MGANPSLIVFTVATTLIPLILAVAVHEFAHVAMARFLGDRTGEDLGRLTLNPIAHIDPIWTLGIPLFFIVTTGGMPPLAAGKPAPYNPVRLDRKFRGRRISMRTGELLVAAAGPASNVVLALLATGLVFVLVRAGVDPYDPKSLATLVFRFTALNVMLAVFNMVPVPPLDGSKVLMSVLPRAAAARYEAISTQLSWALLLLVVMGGSFFLWPVQLFVLRLLHSVAT